MTERAAIDEVQVVRTVRRATARYALATVRRIVRECRVDDPEQVGRLYRRLDNEGCLAELGLAHDYELQLLLLYHGLGQKQPGTERGKGAEPKRHGPWLEEWRADMLRRAQGRAEVASV